MAAALTVEGLRVALPPSGGGQALEVVRGVSFTVPRGGFHAIVGESGCGKSMTAAALTKLPPAAGKGVCVSGRVIFCGQDLLQLSPRRLRQIREEGGVAYVFQDPVSALDPVLSLQTQFMECVPRRLEKRKARELVHDALRAVGLDEVETLLRAYPCQLSGGMAQRINLAMALVRKPALIIADEPTTALDVLSQRTVLSLLRDAAKQNDAAVLLITHNLALVSEYAKTVSVMYAGEIVEDGSVETVLSHPLHPYVKALIGAVPKLSGTKVEDLAVIPGRVPPPSEWLSGRCTFAPRCSEATAKCIAAGHPDLLPAGNDRKVRCSLAASHASPSATPDASNPVASVLVRAKNDAVWIEKTLEAIFRQKTQWPYEVIVCDDASTDDTRKIASKFPVRFIERPQGEYRPGKTLNALVSAASGKIVVFNNADAVPCDETWLSELVTPLLAAPDKPVFTFANQLPRSDATALVRKDSERAFGDGHVQATWRFFFSLASSATWRQRLIDDPFDENIRYSEDVEWTWRNRNHATSPVAVKYCPNARVEHSHNYSLPELAKRFYGEGEADGIIFGDKPSLLRELAAAARETVRDLIYISHRPATWRDAPAAPVRRLTQRLNHWRGLHRYWKNKNRKTAARR